MSADTTTFHKLGKLFRFAKIYGPGRALIKAMGRLRIGTIRGGFLQANAPGVGIIGCGQFAFSTIAYFLRGNARLVGAYDIDPEAAKSLCRVYGAKRVYGSAADLLADGEITLVYIASNHASHGPYACAALEAGKEEVDPGNWTAR